jgi:L-seryl-tRNA(Ser) seleniumtransferase/D-glucosaminate-6-phosphate ammonia-lyase
MTTDQFETVINAAGKLTALGGSAQSAAVAAAQATWAQRHVDLAGMRRVAGEKISRLTGGEATCITTGAAAGIAIGVAAVLTGTNRELIRRVPDLGGGNGILLQAGHAVNFGAPVEQMIRLGGGNPEIFGSTNSVTEDNLADILDNGSVKALLYVKSHHCVQDNMISLSRCIALCHARELPVIVDAAAEEDLRRYIEVGADLVTYSGGKAFGGPTVGFITGRKSLIDACERQSQGIARAMKVGKEAIAGLLVALDEYTAADPAGRLSDLSSINEAIMTGIEKCRHYAAYLKPDEAGRPYARVAISAKNDAFDIRDLVTFLGRENPVVRTRNHHLDQGIVLIDPRELGHREATIIVGKLVAFDAALP